MNMDFSGIKLVIWDLDETFWNGVLSEGEVQIPEENIALIRNMADAGVMCSVCSKNDEAQVLQVLSEKDLTDLFVFNSINWSPKGERVRQIISEMNLRPQNVLFIDDNTMNLREAQALSPELQTTSVDVLPGLIAYFESIAKKDPGHKRLEQYKLLEKKNRFRAQSGSNTEFLNQCNIRVEIHKDCIAQVERIAELVQRTNQLNFTKLRSTQEELKLLFADETVDAGYVTVTDAFGDYGITGFYAKKENQLIHFLFSCRTLNMGIEQYVYNYLGRPAIDIVPEVSSSLDGAMPDWINKKEAPKQKKNNKKKLRGKIVIKGPCDMEQMFSFIEPSSNIITEFTYINGQGISIEHYNHTTQIINSLILDEKDKEELRSLPFCDPEMYSTAIFSDDVKIVMLSLFNDPHLGVYRNKNNGNLMAFGEYLNDLTDITIREKLISRQLFTANHQFTREELSDFSEKYEYLGRLTPMQVLENLKFIFSKLSPESIFILCLGSEINIDKSNYVGHESYVDRHIYHKELNGLVRDWAKEETRIKIIDVNNYISSEEDFLDTINHMKKPVYYKMSSDFIKIVNENSKSSIEHNKAPSFIRKMLVRGKRRIRYILFNER